MLRNVDSVTCPVILSATTETPPMVLSYSFGFLMVAMLDGYLKPGSNPVDPVHLSLKIDAMTHVFVMPLL